MSKLKQTKIPVTLGLDNILRLAVEQRGDYIKFKTGNSNYELFKI